jgi:hypothetical protein
VGHECLKLEAGMEVVASRLETRRYGAYMGATVEFNKMEGFTFDSNTGTGYVAISDVAKMMLDDPASKDFGGPNHLKTAANKCGCVYQFASAAGVSSTDGLAINSDKVLTHMSAAIWGKPLDGRTNLASTSNPNSCDINSISSPDNLAWSDTYNTLLIGEDTGKHENNLLWSYNPATGELARLMSVPLGAEVTSVDWLETRGCTMIEAVAQHPYSELSSFSGSLETLSESPFFSGTSAWVGVVTGRQNKKESGNDDKDVGHHDDKEDGHDDKNKKEGGH